MKTPMAKQSIGGGVDHEDCVGKLRGKIRSLAPRARVSSYCIIMTVTGPFDALFEPFAWLLGVQIDVVKLLGCLLMSYAFAYIHRYLFTFTFPFSIAFFNSNASL